MARSSSVRVGSSDGCTLANIPMCPIHVVECRRPCVLWFVLAICLTDCCCFADVCLFPSLHAEAEVGEEGKGLAVDATAQDSYETLDA